MENFLKAALSGVDSDVINKLPAHLSDVGVITEEDLKFVEEDDIGHILKPIQSKKLLHHIKLMSCSEANVPSCSKISNGAILSEVPSSSCALPSDWAENFVIPWDAFPKEIIESCNEGKFPEKKHVNEMVRIIATSIANIDGNAGRKNLRIISEKIISKYPTVFQDKIGDSIIGNGATTIMKKLENCLDNKKRIRDVNYKFDFEGSHRKRKRERDSYGCVSWQPSDLPETETRASQKTHQLWLKNEFNKVEKDEKKVEELMKITYASQRFFINNTANTIAAVQAEWPFLLDAKCMLLHAEELLGKNIFDFFNEVIPKKGKMLYSFLKTKATFPAVGECFVEIEAAKKELMNLTPEVSGCFLLLLALFGEERACLFQCSEKEQNLQEPILTPYIIAFGQSIHTAKEFAVVIDGITTTYIKNFISAIAILFSSFFVFNIEYPEGATLTMEFIQRFFAEINPARGTKVPKKKNAKQHAITPKILKLLHEVKGYESVFGY